MPLRAPRKYRDRRSLKTLDPSRDLPPSASVTVLEVVRGVSIDTLIWRFSSDLTFGGGNCPQLQADDGEGWQSPTSAMQTGPGEVTAFYEGETFDDSSPWQVVDAPAGISFASGTMALPQSGLIAISP